MLEPMLWIQSLHSLNPIFLEIFLVFFAYSTIVVTYRVWSLPGLYAYMPLAIAIANIQVLKAAEFAFLPDPVALGTVLFSSTYLCTDIVTEMHGRKEATKLVLIGFAMYFFWTTVMIITVGYKPIDPALAPDWAWAAEVQQPMERIFLPTVSILAAGMISYLISELLDVIIYARIRKSGAGNYLWLRNNLSTYIATFVDNTIFSVLAWIVFAPDPLPLDVLFYTFILGTYLFRIFIATLDTPFLYLAVWSRSKRAA